MNKEMYVDILRRLWDEVRRKITEKWRINILFLLHDNAPAHRQVSFKDILARNNVTKLEHSPDLTQAEFYLFPLLKLALK